MKKYITFVECDKIDDQITIALFNYSEKEILAPNGEKLQLISIIPIKNIKEILENNEITLEEDTLNKYMYIFSCYDKNDYFIDSITCNGSEEEFISIKSGYTKVVIEDEDFVSVSLNNSYEMVLNDSPIEASWFGDEPEFLQNEDYYFLEDYVFLAQINGLDLPNDLNDLFYFSDAIGYIFIKKDLKEGVFFVQNT